MYPSVRLRRNRQSQCVRDLLAETNILSSDLILPIFVTHGKNFRQPIKKMPGIEVFSPDLVLKQAELAAKLNIKAIALFPIIKPEDKTACGKESYNPDNIICSTIRLLKEHNINIIIIADVALDPYTSHGHDGLIKLGKIDNDSTIAALCKQARVLSASGVDIVAPSDMMDGRVQAIRKDLDQSGACDTIILSYAVKYASNLYGPFREIVGSKKLLSGTDKKTYQMDIRNIKEATREVYYDQLEGADIIMIKPAMLYLDVISSIKNSFHIPIFGYQTSGEYAMIKYASQSGCLDYDATMLESLICIKRAGASAIFTYDAIEVAKQISL